ncbi:MAG: DUF488 domain-containing protein [Rubrivivax sp.]|nr:DUF488 domain-containing protein [Rubrivivax sp.]
MGDDGPVIFTIGYQGRSVDELIAELTAREIATVLDIRENPRSRKPGFSGKQLAAALEAAGIGYRHLQILGTPAPLREDYRATGDLAALFAGYRAYLAGQPTAAQQVADSAAAARVVLFCFERDPAECHRSVLVGVLRERFGIGAVTFDRRLLA